MKHSPTLSLFVFAALSGCADETQSSEASGVVVTTASPVIVTLGGFTSCAAGRSAATPAETDRWDRSVRLSERFSRGDQRWVRGCFDRASRLYFVSSQAPTVVQSTTLAELTPFFDAVAALTEGRQHPLYVMGHSYGGWLAMYLAWYLPTNTDIALLYAVDPITPAHCSASSYLWAVANPFNASAALAGCQRAPADFTLADRSYLREHVRAGGWRHFYQRNFVPLRSSAYTDGVTPHRSYDLSPMLTRTGVYPSWNAHVGISELSLIWFGFESSIATDYGG